MAPASLLGPLHSIGPAAKPSAGSPAQPLELSVDHSAPSNWCWAAVAAAISTYYKKPIEACQIADMCLKDVGECCPPPTDPKDRRNKEAGIAGALIKIGQTGEPSGWLEFPDLVEEIKNLQPVCIHIQWPTGSVPAGHFLVVVGVNEAMQTVAVRDNRFGDNDDLPYETLRKGYHEGIGEWDGSYKTAMPAEDANA